MKTKSSRELAILFSASLVVAFVCSYGPRHFLQKLFHDDMGAIYFSMWLSLFWFGLVAVAISRFRRRGVWLLVEAPFALYYPFTAVFFWIACTLDGCAI